MNYIQMNKFFLGICVGMQYMFHSSEESNEHKGLNLVKGKVKKFDFLKVNGKIPLIGKNTIHQSIIDWEKTILKNINNSKEMYFLHSYYCLADKNFELSKTNYNDFNFTSSIKIENTYGVQFHPEKSGIEGLQIFKNFISLE